MFGAFKRKRNRKKLTDENFAFLFDVPPEDEYVVFDCETTGLDTKKDEIISIGAVKVKKNKILMSEAFHLYIKPDALVSKESIAIHQIRNCDLEEALEVEEAIKQFLHFIGSSKLVGYYLEFDVTMINRYVKPLLGITLPNEQIEVSAIYHDKKMQRIPQGHVDLRFNSIMEDLNLPFMGKHDALNDAVMTAMIFIKLSYPQKKII